MALKKNRAVLEPPSLPSSDGSDGERYYSVEIPVMARLAVEAESRDEATSLAAEVLRGGKRIQAITADGIPFTLRVL